MAFGLGTDLNQNSGFCAQKVQLGLSSVDLVKNHLRATDGVLG